MESAEGFWMGFFASTVQMVGFVVYFDKGSKAAPLLALLSSALFLNRPKVSVFFELGCAVPPALMFWFLQTRGSAFSFMTGPKDPALGLRLILPVLPVIFARRLLQ